MAVEKLLHRAVAIRAPAGNIAHGDVVRRTKCASNDVAQLPEHGGGMDLTKGAKQCKYIHGFSLFLGVRYQKYTGKAIFMPLSIGVGIVYTSNIFEIIFRRKKADTYGSVTHSRTGQKEGF